MAVDLFHLNALNILNVAGDNFTTILGVKKG
jgi:hypothetical protein